MPGIVGLITRMPRKQASRQLELMVESICHEPFYRMGSWEVESLGVYVGWVTRDSAACDGMPLRNERGDMGLVFSGEEFPMPGTARRLRERGHEFGGGQTHLIHLYEEDQTFLSGLNGKFHGLLVDQNRETVALFNDRYGMHRIYYHQAKDAFYFAAEAKAILRVRPELRTIDPRGLGEFVACGSVLENRTLFERIQVLPAASQWIFRDASLERKSSYFDSKEWEEQEELDTESYYRELRRVFTENLPRYFNGDQRIGMSLTGGLDSRMIMAWQKCQPGMLPCYTFGDTLRDCQDIVVARQVAQACGQNHHVIRVEREFLDRFPHYAERAVYLTDGCVDVGRAPDLYLNERAREVALVRMTGLYGGEVLRQVRAFKPMRPLPGLFHPELVAHVRGASETYARLLQGHPLSFAVFKQGPWHHHGILALEQTQVAMVSPFIDNDLVRTVFRAPKSTLATSELSLRLIGDGNRALLGIRTDRGLAGGRGHIGQVASRCLLEFLFKAEYAYDMGMPQWLARVDHALSAFRLERFFLGRHKVFHFRTWYRDALAGYIRETLLDPRSLARPYIQRKGLEAVVHGHLKGDQNYTIELHTLLTLELLHRLYLDDGPASSAVHFEGDKLPQLA
jgi:asparagine synthase (glutamine-hydrolysing)